MSEPEEPIVFWVENSTPKEIVPAVIAGIENWNIAFEEAGFINAVVAKTNLKMRIGMLQIMIIMLLDGPQNLMVVCWGLAQA